MSLMIKWKMHSQNLKTDSILFLYVEKFKIYKNSDFKYKHKKLFIKIKILLLSTGTI